MTQTGETFTTRQGLTTAWAKARGDLLERHGIPRDQKGVNVARGLLVVDVRLHGRWVPLTDDKSTVIDRIRLGGGDTYRVRIAAVSDRRVGTPDQT